MTKPLWQTSFERVRGDFDRERLAGQAIAAMITCWPPYSMEDPGPPPLRPQGCVVAQWGRVIEEPEVATNYVTGEWIFGSPLWGEEGELVFTGKPAEGGRWYNSFCRLATAVTETLITLPHHARDRLGDELSGYALEYSGGVNPFVEHWVRVLFNLALQRPCLIRMPATRTFWLPGRQLALDEHLEPSSLPSALGTMGSAISWGRPNWLPADPALRHWHAVIPDVFTASAYACDVLLDWACNPRPEAHPESATPTGDRAEQAEGASGDDVPPRYALDLLRVLVREGWNSPERRASQDTIAGTVSSGKDRRYYRRQFGWLTRRGYIDVAGGGRSAGTYITPTGSAYLARQR